MRVMTVRPGQKGTADVEEVPDSASQDGAPLVRGRMIGVGGTDQEIAKGVYGTPPGRRTADHWPRKSRRGAPAPGRIGLRAGDLVVEILCRPDPCPAGPSPHARLSVAEARRNSKLCRTDGSGQGTAAAVRHSR